MSSFDNVLTCKRLSGVGKGTPVAVANFVLSAGFGTTATVSAVRAGSTDMRGEITITSAGTGQGANPTCTLTFVDGPFTGGIPFVVTSRAGGANQRTVEFEPAPTASTVVMTFLGTPVAADTYKVAWFTCE